MSSINRLDMNSDEIGRSNHPMLITVRALGAGVAGAAFGHTATRLFLSINPVAGAIFGAATAAANSLLSAPIFDDFFHNIGVEKTLKYVLKTLASCGAGLAACALAGYGLSLKTAALTVLSINAYGLIIAAAAVSLVALAQAGNNVYQNLCNNLC